MKNNTAVNITDKAPSLLKALLLDIFVRHWTVTVLALIFIGSSMVLVHTSHNTRRLTIAWQGSLQAYQLQQVTWESLRLELSSLREANRISSLAKKQLGMVEVSTTNEKVISL